MVAFLSSRFIIIGYIRNKPQSLRRVGCGRPEGQERGAFVTYGRKRHSLFYRRSVMKTTVGPLRRPKRGSNPVVFIDRTP